MTDFYKSVNIGNHFLIKSCLCRQPGTSPALQAAGYATVIASICTTERVRFAEGYSCNMIRNVDICKNSYVHVVAPGGTTKFQEFFERMTKEMTASTLPLCESVVSAKFFTKQEESTNYFKKKQFCDDLRDAQMANIDPSQWERVHPKASSKIKRLGRSVSQRRMPRMESQLMEQRQVRNKMDMEQ